MRGTPRTRAPAPAKPTQASQACSSRRRHPPADPPLASSSIERSPPKAQSLFLSPSTPPPRLFLSLFLRGSPPLHSPPQIYPFQRKEEVFPRPTRKPQKPHRPRTGNSTPAAFPLRSLRLFHASVSHDPIQVSGASVSVLRDRERLGKRPGGKDRETEAGKRNRASRASS